MTLLACVVAVVVGIGLSFVLRRVCESLASSGTDTWAYYFSGAVFAVTLSVPPTLTLIWADSPPDMLGNLSREQIFRSVFPGLVLLLSAYLIVAKRLRITWWNPVAMGAICAATTVLALALNLYFGKGYEVYGSIVLVATILALLPSSIALGRVHAQFEPE
jgi:hypothetical protein